MDLLDKAKQKTVLGGLRAEPLPELVEVRQETTQQVRGSILLKSFSVKERCW